jgi:hypothetical protein
MKIGKNHLVMKLADLDHKLMNLWINEDTEISDDERWEIFVVLLETRVEILNCFRDAGIPLTQEQCVPQWLERMTSHRKEIRLRELRQLDDKLRRDKKKFETYENVSELKKTEGKRK